MRDGASTGMASRISLRSIRATPSSQCVREFATIESMNTSPLILLAAGGTGGHLFPAEALGVELMKRGMAVRLATDARALRYSGLFTRQMIDVVPSETVRGRSPLSLARTGIMLAAGTMGALDLMRRLKPKAVVGFGGYPTLPPLLAARLFRIPSVIHDSNAVLGRANRFLSRGATAIATSLPGVLDRDPALAAKTVTTGTPMRPAILSAAAVPFATSEPDGPLRLLVVGGSQGARVMSDIVPPAIEQLEPVLWSRLRLVQQVRDEDLARVRAVYDRFKLDAELAPFFADLPARLASSHLVISRSGAGTVAELGAVGRPSILVPLPGSIDQDQFANAGVLAQAGGAIRIAQQDFTPDRLAAEISSLAAEPARLSAMAAGARTVGKLDAAERLADLVAKVAGI
jgi:UDP-N-acetylglucosamine--N-acetylmuramyl-(pentapeptide) pyrophosphoryl-undecaprenol N-acetylglucosamine transferase